MRQARGYSLLELLLVVVLIAALATLAAMAIGQALPGQQLRGTARDLAADLRYTRARAIASGREQVFVMDLDRRTWTAAGEREGAWPDALRVLATTAREEQPAQGRAAVRFFPDGSATGGRFLIGYQQAGWRVDVAWLTGEVSLRRGEAPP
ncbi:type II secretion system protein XpsH [Arenimonas fontis]|uniref:Type II secretion system protein H n=1 Tax=Arenimonas fontis TaxID=2608255 RepID=A0A5B2ZCR5_9GAMM|nr:GspH/FimT family protein [Arenimonas fontis]KAA2284984.1 type II secretion system protein GspH [Arenimonas fontis]